MKNFILLTLILFTSTSAFNQDLKEKISEKASFVFAINGDITMQKVSTRDIDNSQLFKELLDEFFRRKMPVVNLDGFGVDYNQTMYFAYENDTDVNMYYFTYHIQDLPSFEKVVKEKIEHEGFENKDGLNVISYYFDSRLIWNENTALLMISDYVGRQYDEYGYWYDDYYFDTTEEVTEAAVDYEAIENMTQEEWEAYMNKEKEERAKKEEEERLAREKKEKERQEKREKKEKYVDDKMWARAKTFFSDELKNSGKQFKGTINSSADASLWYDNHVSFFDLFWYGRYMGYYNPYGSMFNMGNFFNGELTADLYLNETDIQIKSEMTYHGELSEAFSKIYSKKIDKQFTKYLSNSDLGYASFAFDTEEMLNAYPDIIKNMMLRYDTSLAEEYSLLADIFSLIIDEENIANAITGDALIILNEVSNKEVEYYSYDYDENYNYERKLRTRVELLPDFSFLVGSNEGDLINKAFKLGLKHEGLKKVDKGYQIIDKYNDFPFDIYFAFDQNIFLTTTSKKQLAQFINGGSGEKLAADKSKLITKNSGAMYLDMPTLLGQILTSDEIHRSERRMFTAMQKDIQTMSAKFYNKGGSTFIEASTKVPETEENGALYLLHFIDHMIEAERNR